MRSLVRRIALNGLLTAGVLAAMGFAYAEIASMWLAGTPVQRVETAPAVSQTNDAAALRDSLRVRVPLTMAACGLIFIVVAELAMFWWRGNPAPVAKIPAERQIDPTQKLLEELLAQADAAAAAAKEPATTTAAS